jgi:mannose-6-phosphate isomerase-like protein (cupin superfamily)
VKFRRVVTGLRRDGKSTVVLDSESPHVVEVPFWPGLAMATLWTTAEMPADNAGSDDRALTPVGHSPAPSGSIFRIYQFPPDSARPPDCGRLLGLEGATEEDWKNIHPMMHATRSVDYLVILSGEMTMIMEDRSEIVLRAGDCVVQRGTKHAWSNRGTDPVVLIAVLVHGSAPKIEATGQR